MKTTKRVMAVLLASMLLLTGCAAKKNSEPAAAPEQETKTETQVEAQAEEPAETQVEEPAETQSRDLLIEAGKSVTDQELDRFVILAESIRDFDITDDLDQITCPTLVIGSMDDQVLGAEASVQIAEHLKNQKGVVLYMYNGYGHASYDTAPDFKERVLYFLSSGKGE